MAKKKIRRARRPIEPTAGKLAIAVSLLRRKRGATVEQIANAIDWQTRGASTAISRVRLEIRGREREAENRWVDLQDRCLKQLDGDE